MIVARIRPAAALGGADGGAKPVSGGGRKRRGVVRTGVAVGGNREERRTQREVVERSAVPVDVVEEVPHAGAGERRQGRKTSFAAGKSERMHGDKKVGASKDTRIGSKGSKGSGFARGTRADGKGNRGEHKHRGGDAREDRSTRFSNETRERRGKAEMPLTAAQEESARSISAGERANCCGISCTL